MIKYTLPDFTNGLTRNLYFIKLAQSHPEYFMDEIKIESVYGCFPSCIMNGGRTFIRERYTSAQMEQTFSILQEQGVIARLTFTNMLVGKEHLEDAYVTDMLEIAQRYPVEVIVYSDEIAACIKERYGLKTVLSTTRGISDIQAFNEATKHYDYVVCDYNMNKNVDFLSQIEDPHKVEMMVNEFCRFQCPHREAHYRHNSEDQLNGCARPFPCSHQDGGEFFAHKPGHQIYLTNEEVVHTHQTYGIDYYKIVGRGIPSETVLESYAYYLLKPEYRNQVKQSVRYMLQRR